MRRCCCCRLYTGIGYSQFCDPLELEYSAQYVFHIARRSCTFLRRASNTHASRSCVMQRLLASSNFLIKSKVTNYGAARRYTIALSTFLSVQAGEQLEIQSMTVRLNCGCTRGAKNKSLERAERRQSARKNSARGKSRGKFVEATVDGSTRSERGNSCASNSERKRERETTARHTV